MNNKTKNIVVTSVFVVFVAFFVVMCAFSYFNPTEKSEAERRPLAQFPTEITWESIINTKDEHKSTIKQFEKYSVDQFPFREFFRSLKAHFQLDVLGLNENNGMASVDGYIAKIEPDFTPGLVDYSTGRLQFIYNKYLQNHNGNVYVSLIPDKNYYLGRDYGYPSPDYEWLAGVLKEKLPEAEYIDLFGSLELSDFYRTDTHWSQDKLDRVLATLGEKMGFADRLSGKYTENKLEGFEGVYYAQSALYPKPDTLTYLTNDIINGCTVYDYETKKTYSVYNLDEFYGDDGYSFFLSGTRALLRIDNPNATTDKELVIFRDSFGSSLAPLMAEGYSSIYVVDIRYVMPEFLGTLIDLEGKDVLFIYSSLVLNAKAFR